MAAQILNRIKCRRHEIKFYHKYTTAAQKTAVKVITLQICHLNIIILKNSLAIKQGSDRHDCSLRYSTKCVQFVILPCKKIPQSGL